jgi:carboxymethylenebutenolidase
MADPFAVLASCDDGKIAAAIEQCPNVVGIVSHGAFPPTATIPQLTHLAEKGGVKTQVGNDVTYRYPEAKSAFFVIPGHQDFITSAAAVAHTRSLTFLKACIGGPIFDLEAIWEEHTFFEFGDRSVANTMGTMVQEPYVNHIPTMTGGVGRKQLTNFYTRHFIWNNPDDTVLDLVSRTIGIDRIVDEFIFTFTHDKVIDWL